MIQLCCADLDVTNTTADSDYDIELGDIEEEHDLEIDELNGMYDTDDTSVVNSLEGELEHEHPGALDECYGDSNTAVALPKDYPEVGKPRWLGRFCYQQVQELTGSCMKICLP